MEDAKLANPAPLGLMGFGLTTILLNVHNIGFLPLMSVVAAVGICYGGIAQIIAGILEYKKGNTFGLTAFVSYGFFWLSLVVIWYLPATGAVAASNTVFVGVYLLLWAIFTLFMYCASLKLNKATQFVFGSLFLLFLLLSWANFSGSVPVERVAGVVGIICGASAVYLAMAEVLNEVHKKRVLPIG